MRERESKRARAREREQESESERGPESGRARERERDSAPLFPSCQVIAKSMSFLIMTFHAISATITSQSCPFSHFCHFTWSADGRDIVLFMEKDDEKVRCVHLSQHQSIRFAWERVSPLFCSFEIKSSQKKYNFGSERLQFKSKFLVTVKYTSALKRYSKWGMHMHTIYPVKPAYHPTSLPA